MMLQHGHTIDLGIRHNLQTLQIFSPPKYPSI